MLHETFGNFAFAIACRVLSLRDIGPALSPFNAFLILTGIETLPLRMQRHCDNAQAVARMARRASQGRLGELSRACPATATTTSPRNTCPKGAGAVFTFGLKGGYDAGVKLVSNVKLFSHLANIGDTRSLIIHPASTTHRQLSDAQKVAGRRRARRGAAVDRHRGQGRHHRRSRAGAGGANDQRCKLARPFASRAGPSGLMKFARLAFRRGAYTRRHA